MEQKLQWWPFKLVKWSEIEKDERLSQEYKDEVFKKEIYENIDKALKDKKTLVIIELIKSFVDDIEKFKPFYNKHLNWNKTLSEPQNFVLDVTVSLKCNWTYFLDKLHEKGASEYVDYTKRKLGL